MFAYTYHGDECAVSVSKHTLILEIGDKLVCLKKDAPTVKPSPKRNAEIINFAERKAK